MDFGGIVKGARERLGLTQDGLAKRLRLKQPTVAAWETNQRRPSTGTLHELARVIGVPAAELLEAMQRSVVEVSEVPPEEVVRPARPARPVFLSNVRAPPVGREALPLVSAARGGLQEMFTPDGPLDWVEMLPSLRDVRGAYAVWVVGESMEPRYRPGQILYVHPRKPLTPGCGVVVALKTGEVMVKEFVRGAPAGAVVLRDYNERPDGFDVTAAERECCDVVVGSLEP
jgi:phage repressor protein C with HTH and peptisase S24 domain